MLTAGLMPVRSRVAVKTAASMSSGSVSFRPPLLPCMIRRRQLTAGSGC